MMRFTTLVQANGGTSVSRDGPPETTSGTIEVLCMQPRKWLTYHYDVFVASHAPTLARA